MGKRRANGPAVLFQGRRMRLSGQKITVLGAGVAGLSFARAAALRGAEVTVLEQAEAIREVGAGLQISPNGGVVLRALGLEPGLADRATRAGGVQLIDGASGKRVLGLDLARLRPNQSYHFLHRADLIDHLAMGARAIGVQFRLLTKVERVELSGDKPCLVTAQGAVEQPDLLIGADGLHSVVRRALNGEEMPFFTGQAAWRAIIPAEAGAEAVAEIHMGPGRHLVSYPLRGGTLRNIIGVEERQDWAAESWNMRDDPVHLRSAFAGFSPRVRGWLDQVDQTWLWGLFRHSVAAVWQRQLPEGAVALVGDAAHPTLPFLAQGASMGLEDAWSLAAVLDADGPAGLPGWQALRAPRCTRIVAAANGNARAYHLRGPMRPLAHLGLRLAGAVMPAAPLKRFDWLYGYDVTAGAGSGAKSASSR